MQQSQKKQASIRLKKGKDRPLLQGHHWIYSGAIAENTTLKTDLFTRVLSHSGTMLGTAMLGASGNSIVGHMLSIGEETIEEAISARIRSALALRARLFNPTVTNALRLINAEGDGIPGLIVDSYAGVLVLQISHPSLEGVKGKIMEELVAQAKPRAIYEKSTSFLRKKEGLEEVKGHLYGEEIKEVEILENGLRYSVDLLDSQKTGLFLDQREMRQIVNNLSVGKRVLNCFAYTGGFSVSALKGGATHVDSVETSQKCGNAIAKNILLNGLSTDQHRFFGEDAIRFVVNQKLDYDVVILDPPAFAKQKSALDKAFKAYKDLNKAAIEKMPAGSILITCSCSYHVSEELFQNILFRASLEAGRKVRIIGRHAMAPDHPISIFHPESSYLKSLILYID
ncbi:MAG TPA: class I SAM-dependent rRNA methyltransferase [Chlamydiales bacterium]|jgi:23S rRNA (cytosine1962-C5)-methyltransferase|nr:class I SAM-dependent rRNA methyltransferase [Chlamydiales bacterium]